MHIVIEGSSDVCHVTGCNFPGSDNVIFSSTTFKSSITYTVVTDSGKLLFLRHVYKTGSICDVTIFYQQTCVRYDHCVCVRACVRACVCVCVCVCLVYV